MIALFARADLDSFASLRQGGAMSDKNTPESEAKSNGVAIACYVLATIFFALAAVGYGRLHESWPPEIDGSVQKCLIIAFVLFLIPSVKEMNIAGVLSFKAKVEEAKAEVKELRQEVRSLTQFQISSANSDAKATALSAAPVIFMGGDASLFGGGDKDPGAQNLEVDELSKQAASLVGAETEAMKFRRMFAALRRALRLSVVGRDEVGPVPTSVNLATLWGLAARIQPRLEFMSSEVDKVRAIAKRDILLKNETPSEEEYSEGIQILQELARSLLVAGFFVVDQPEGDATE